MPKRVNPDTSLEAYKSLDPIRVSQTMMKIAEAIKELGKANYEMVAAHTGMPEEKVWKRFVDCYRARLIHRTEETVLTKRNRPSHLFAYGPETETTKRKERVMKGPSVSDFSRALKKVIPTQTQERLF